MDLKVQSDGKIIVIGETEYCVNGICGEPQFLMMRPNDDGSPDSSFATQGKLLTLDVFGDSTTFMHKVIAYANDYILISGRMFSKTAYCDNELYSTYKFI